MIEQRYIEWMNMEIDGVLPPDKISELHKYLSSDPEATTYYESLKSTVSIVDATEDPGPPPHLEQRVLSALPWKQRRPIPASNGVKEFLDRLFRRPVFRYAAVFCVGIVTGLLFYSAINFDGTGGELENSFLSGTMRQITTEAGLRQTQGLDVNLEQARGQVSLYESKNILLTEVVLDSPGTIEWSLQYDENDVVFEGYRRFKNESGDINVTRSGMHVSQSGDARYLLFFTRRDSSVDPMVLKLFSANQLLLEKPLAPSRTD